MMMITELRDIWDCFGFYPDALHYFIKSENEEDTIYFGTDGNEMDDFIDEHGYRYIKNVAIKKDGNEIHLYVELR